MYQLIEWTGFVIVAAFCLIGYLAEVGLQHFLWEVAIYIVLALIVIGLAVRDHSSEQFDVSHPMAFGLASRLDHSSNCAANKEDLRRLPSSRTQPIANAPAA